MEGYGWNSLNKFLIKWISIVFIFKILGRIVWPGAVHPEVKFPAAVPNFERSLANSTDHHLSSTLDDICIVDVDSLFMHPFRDFLALALCIAWYMLRQRVAVRKQEAALRNLILYHEQLERHHKFWESELKEMKRETKVLRIQLRKQYSRLFDKLFDLHVAVLRVHPPPITHDEDSDVGA